MTVGGSQSGRRSIALFVDRLDLAYQTSVVEVALDRAREKNVEIFCIAGGSLRQSEDSRNLLYDLVPGNSADALVVMLGAIGNALGPEAVATRILGKWHVPIVSLGAHLAPTGPAGDLATSISGIRPDGRQGLKEAVDHLWNYHRRRRFAFICGPEESFEAKERLAAFEEALQAYGRSVEPPLLVSGDFRRQSGEAAIGYLFRAGVKERPDAIVAANDEMALGALQALQERNIGVPDDVSVVGFDDVAESAFVEPSLATVRQPLADQGRGAIDMCLSEIDGETFPHCTLARTGLERRRSCGCSERSDRAAMIQQRLHQMLGADRRSRVLSDINRELIGSGDRGELITLIETSLRALGINGCLLYQYQGQEQRPTSAECLLAWREGKRFQSEEGGRVVLTDLLGAGWKRVFGSGAVVAEPLCFREEKLGLALLEVRGSEWLAYEQLCEHISIALSGVRAREVQTRNEKHLASLTRFLSELDSYPDILRTAVDTACQVTKAAFGGYRQHGEKKHISWPADSARPTEADEPNYHAAAERFFEDHRLLDETSPVLHDDFRGMGVSILAAPVLSRVGCVTGEIVLARSNPFHTDQKEFLRMLAREVGEATERRRLNQAIQAVAQAPARAREMARYLNRSLSDLTDPPGFDFACVWLLGPGSAIELFAEKGVPSPLRRVLRSSTFQQFIAERASADVLDLRDHPDRARLGLAEANLLLLPIKDGERAVGIIGAGVRTTDPRTNWPLKRDDLLASASQDARQLADMRPQASLERIADEVIRRVGAGSASIHVFQGSRLLIQAGAGRARESFLTAYPPRREGGIGRRALQDRDRQWVVETNLKTVHPGLAALGVVEVAAVALEVGKSIEGVLYVHLWNQDGKKPRTFSNRQLKDVKNVFVREIEILIASYIQMTQAIDDLHRRDKEIEAIRVVENAILAVAGGSDIRDVFDLILRKALEIIDADHGYIYRYDPSTKGVRLYVDETGIRQQKDSPTIPLGEGIVGTVAQKRQPFRWPDMQNSEFKDAVDQNVHSVLAVPLKEDDGGDGAGVIGLEHRDFDAFDQEDEALLGTLANLAVMAIRNADLFQSVEKQSRPLRALAVLAARMRRGVQRLDDVLRAVLTGITAGDGGGFSRAMVFLHNRSGGTLDGKQAVGALTREEAHDNWNGIEASVREARAADPAHDTLEWLIAQGEVANDRTRKALADPAPLNQRVQAISLDPGDPRWAVARAVRSAATIVVKASETDPLRERLRIDGDSTPSDYAFVAVPLLGRRGDCVGCLVADNRFLLIEREMTVHSRITLEAFANVAANWIESTSENVAG